jgi:hypothetical protein
MPPRRELPGLTVSRGRKRPPAGVVPGSCRLAGRAAPACDGPRLEMSPAPSLRSRLVLRGGTEGPPGPRCEPPSGKGEGEEKDGDQRRPERTDEKSGVAPRVGGRVWRSMNCSTLQRGSASCSRMPAHGEAAQNKGKCANHHLTQPQQNDFRNIHEGLPMSGGARSTWESPGCAPSGGAPVTRPRRCGAADLGLLRRVRTWMVPSSGSAALSSHSRSRSAAETGAAVVAMRRQLWLREMSKERGHKAATWRAIAWKVTCTAAPQQSGTSPSRRGPPKRAACCARGFLGHNQPPREGPATQRRAPLRLSVRLYRQLR